MTTDMPKTYDRFVSWGDVDEDGAGEQSTRKNRVSGNESNNEEEIPLDSLTFDYRPEDFPSANQNYRM